MLLTPVTQLRKDAPGSVTLAKVAAHFKRRRFPRQAGTVGAFERAQFKQPEERFLELYAEAIQSTVAKVRAAYASTLRMRERRKGPFADERVA